MQIEVGRHTFKVSRSVEHHRAKPKRVRPRTPHPHIAFVPGVVKECPRFRPTFTRRHAYLCSSRICTAAFAPIGVVSTAKRTCYHTSSEIKPRALPRQRRAGHTGASSLTSVLIFAAL